MFDSPRSSTNMISGAGSSNPSRNARICSKIAGSNALWFVKSAKQQIKAPESRFLQFEHEECKRNRLNQVSCSTKAPWMFDSLRSSLVLLEKAFPSLL